MAHGDYSHIEVPADDPARAQRFYTAVFGWTFQPYEGFPDYYGYTTPAGESGVGGAVGKRGVTAADKIRNYLTVDSIDQTLPKVEQNSGKVVTPKTEIPGMGWYAVLTDSEGNEFGIYESQPR